jgi:hypothetical protein
LIKAGPVIEGGRGHACKNDTQLGRVRGVAGVDWAVPFFKGLTVAHTREGIPYSPAQCSSMPWLTVAHTREGILQ